MDGKNQNMFNPQLAHNLLTLVPAMGTTLTYLAITFAESTGAVDPVYVWEKFGIAGVAGLVLFFFVRWLLKDRERLERKVEELHSQRQTEAQKQIDELKQMIRDK
jgi:hypothetical protein